MCKCVNKWVCECVIIASKPSTLLCNIASSSVEPAVFFFDRGVVGGDDIVELTDDLDDATDEVEAFLL